MGTKREELESTTGCLAKAADDEPIFVLRAQDVTAPAAVRGWVFGVHLGHRSAGTWPSQRTCQKPAEAEALAVRMEAWQHEHGCKVPD